MPQKHKKLRGLLCAVFSFTLILLNNGCHNNDDSSPFVFSEDSQHISDSEKSEGSKTAGAIYSQSGKNGQSDTIGLTTSCTGMSSYGTKGYTSPSQSHGNNNSQVGALLMKSPLHGSVVITARPAFSWFEASNAESYTFLLELYKPENDTFTPALKVKGIVKTEYTPVAEIKRNSIYRWKVTAVNSNGSEIGIGGNDVDGNIFMSPIDARNHPANTGLDFSFSGSVSKKVLCNYLSRSIIYSDEHTATRGLTFDETLRFILYTGAKYIGRAACTWNPGAADESDLDSKKASLKKAHNIDPDIVFEACIFECISIRVNDIAIPSWVFQAFGQPVATRNFNYDSMIFLDGSFKNHWGDNASVPDMTRLETQMFFYYRACRYIDAGYEGLHMGQVHLIGKKDRDYACWTKALNMIRSYAKTHARRKFVFINAHTHGIIGNDRKLLFDFHAYPLRIAPANGSVSHIPTYDNPQKVELREGYSDSIYGRSLGGTTHSGWSCSSLPYFVEFDNFWNGVCDNYIDSPASKNPYCWGMDEISWFANQPQSYRTEFLQYAYDWVRGLSDDGFAEMPGNRTAYMRSSVNQNEFVHHPYVPNNSMFYSKGFDDENTIRNIWISDLSRR